MSSDDNGFNSAIDFVDSLPREQQQAVDENTETLIITHNASSIPDRKLLQTINVDRHGQPFTLESAQEFILQCHSQYDTILFNLSKGQLSMNHCYRYRQRNSSAFTKTYCSPATNREFVIRTEKRKSGNVFTIDIYTHFRQVYTFEEIDSQEVRSRHASINNNKRVKIMVCYFFILLFNYFVSFINVY